MKPIILKNHFREKDTIIYNDCIKNGSMFWNMTNKTLTQRIVDDSGMSENQWQEVLDAVEAGKGDINASSDDLLWFALKYYIRFGVDPEMYEIFIDANDPEWACLYCHTIQNDPKMRQIIINSRDIDCICHYCSNVSNNKAMRQVVIDSNNPEWALKFCHDVQVDSDMRQMVLDANDPELAFKWCTDIKPELDFRLILINSEKYALDFYFYQGSDGDDETIKATLKNKKLNTAHHHNPTDNNKVFIMLAVMVFGLIVTLIFIKSL